MRLNLALALATAASLAGSARAEDARPRSIWLECTAPKVWPVPGRGGHIRLSCRVDVPSPGGPAFWHTVNPFQRQAPAPRLVDPFAVEATARSADLFELGRHALRRERRPLVGPLVDPYEAMDNTVNPFEPAREDAE